MKSQKSSEELELEEIGKLKKETEKALLMSKQSFKRARRSNSRATINPVRSSKPPTEPVGFQFRTEERIRKRSGYRERGVSPNTGAEFISKFPMSLRGEDLLSHHPAEVRV